MKKISLLAASVAMSIGVTTFNPTPARAETYLSLSGFIADWAYYDMNASGENGQVQFGAYARSEYKFDQVSANIFRTNPDDPSNVVYAVNMVGDLNSTAASQDWYLSTNYDLLGISMSNSVGMSSYEDNGENTNYAHGHLSVKPFDFDHGHLSPYEIEYDDFHGFGLAFYFYGDLLGPGADQFGSMFPMDPNAVPEPATFATLGMIGASMLLRRMRRTM